MKILLIVCAAAIFIEFVYFLARRTGDSYYEAAMNEVFGGKIVPSDAKFYIIFGKMDGTKDDVISGLKSIGCLQKAA